MTVTGIIDSDNPRFRNLPLRVLAPVPLPLLQPLLQRVIVHAARTRSGLFDRLGAHSRKRYLIDPLNMPFAFLLCPDPDNPKLRACRRPAPGAYDARIAGTFLTLLDMVDGQLDGDAVFFSRDLTIEGDTEAVVVLRNALDDLDGSIVDDIASAFGAPARLALGTLRRIRRNRHAAL